MLLHHAHRDGAGDLQRWAGSEIGPDLGQGCKCQQKFKAKKKKNKEKKMNPELSVPSAPILQAFLSLEMTASCASLWCGGCGVL